MSIASIPKSSAATIGFSEAEFEAFLKTRQEPAWLVERRRQAFAAFQALPMPSSRDEEWRRTDVRGFKLESFAPRPIAPASERAVAELSPLRKTIGERYAAGLTRVDGQAIEHPKASDLGGAVLIDLATAAREMPELLERWLMTKAFHPKADKLAALHAAFWSGGALLYVPKGVRVEAPLFHLIALSSQANTDLNHTLVVLDEGAEATLVQECSSVSSEQRSAMHCGAVELIVGPSAKLRFVNIQNWDDQTWHFSRERALLARDAELQWTVGAIGSRLSKVNQEVALEGNGARAQVNGVMFTTGRQHLAYFTRQDHAAENTRSDLLYKSGLMDHSRIVWKGMIRVEKGAQKTDAYQKNDNLILSDSARADSIPGLEIEANDVRCTHGATAGRVDEEMIFYAQSRGVDRATAVRLIVEGFFANVYDRITVEPVRETLRHAVAQKLKLGKS